MAATGNSEDRSASLNILYSFPGAIGGPGAGIIAWHQVNQLVCLGHDVTLVVASVARPVVGIRSLVRSLDFVGRLIPERTIGRPRAYMWHDWRARRVLAAGAFDVVHTWPLAGARTLELARRMGVAGVREAPSSHIAVACTAVSREYARLGLETPPLWSTFGEVDRLELEEREYDAATALLVPSDAVADSFLSRGFDSSRLIRHRYGFDPTEIRVPVFERDHPFTAVFMGRGVPRKGLHYALRAWLSSRACETGRLLIYGEIDEDYREQLGELLEHPSVFLCGPTQKPAVAYAKADVLLLPSVEEGSALVTYEAQGAGVVPLVSSASGAVVEHGVNGLIHTPRDTGELTAHLDLLHEQPRALAELRRASLARAQELTWSAAGRILVAAYLTALQQPAELAYGRPTERMWSQRDDSAVS